MRFTWLWIPRGVAQLGSPPSLRFVTQSRSPLLLFGNARLRMTLLVLNSSTLEPFLSFKGLARIDLTAFVVGVMNSVSTPPLRSLAQLELPSLTCGTSCLGSLSSVPDSATFEAPPSLRGASCSEFSPSAEARLHVDVFKSMHMWACFSKVFFPIAALRPGMYVLEEAPTLHGSSGFFDVRMVYDIRPN